jgi:hypothetical protein
MTEKRRRAKSGKQRAESRELRAKRKELRAKSLGLRVRAGAGAKALSSKLYALSPMLYALCSRLYALSPMLFIGIILLMGLSRPAMSKVRLYPQNTDATFEYDDNVTRERLREDYQYGIIWRLYTGFGIRDFIPLSGLDTKAEYTLGMRDVNTTNDEDYNSHSAVLSSKAKLKTGTNISLEEEFRIWNSQSDLFNFYDNALKIGLDQSLGKRTTVYLSYRNGQKWFQNDAPEVQARNLLYHQIGMNLGHDISSAFTVKAGYVYNSSIYNRSPIDFRGRRQVVLEGIQRDRQKVITLGFQTTLLNNTTTLELLNQVVRSTSNSRVFNFDGNRTRIFLLIIPTRKMSVQFRYQIVAYDLEAYQTPDMGYELGEIRTDDQSGITLGATYELSDQVSLQLGYEHIENTVFFTREFYRKNTFSTGLRIKF